MKLRICQAYVGPDIETNLNKVVSIIEKANPGEWIIFPEAMISGYYPEKAVYTSGLNWTTIKNALGTIEQTAAKKKCYCVVGSATLEGNQWRNSCFVFGPQLRAVHHKIKLSRLDRNHFAPGSTLQSFATGQVKVGLLACRELLFPEMWQQLKTEGVKVVFHLNNAVQPHDSLWEHILISRAIENSIFVVSVNNCMPPQSLRSYVIDPTGSVLIRTSAQREEQVASELNLSLVFDDLSSRTDY